MSAAAVLIFRSEIDALWRAIANPEEGSSNFEQEVEIIVLVLSTFSLTGAQSIILACRLSRCDAV